MSKPDHIARPSRRRGGAYILVLATAMLLAVLGTAGMMSARVTHRQAAVGSDATGVVRLAESAVELALYELSHDPDWRTNYTSSEWTAPTTIDGAGVQYVLVDVGDGDLSDDANDPIRVYGRAERDGVARVVSADVTVGSEGGTISLSNGGFESGGSPWFTYNGFGVMAIWNFAPHGGSQNLVLTSRSSSQASLAQDVTDQVENGQAYHLEAYVQMTGSSRPMVVGLAIKTDSGFDQEFTVDGWSGVMPSWNEVSGTVTPAWDGELLQAYFFVRYAEGNTDFAVDDASISVEAASTFAVERGSWRRVLAEEAPDTSVQQLAN